MENKVSLSNLDKIFSNLHMSQVYSRGLLYKASETLYQSYKLKSYKEILDLCNLRPTQAKYIGNTLPIDDKFDEEKLNILTGVIIKKFVQNDLLLDELISTKDIYLEDSIITKNGKEEIIDNNLLGMALMNARSYILQKKENNDLYSINLIKNVDYVVFIYNTINMLIRSENKSESIYDNDLIIISFKVNPYGFKFDYCYIDYAQDLNTLCMDSKIKVINKLSYEFNTCYLNLSPTEPDKVHLTAPELNLETLEYTGSIFIRRLNVYNFIKDLLTVYNYDTSNI